MSNQAKEYLSNLQKKLDKYEITKDGKRLTVRDCLPYGRDRWVMAHYPNGDPDELIEVGIEMFLYKCSPLLFIEKYCSFELPGIGEIPCNNLYYFQKEILKDFQQYQKIVLTKSRQTGMSTLMSLIFFWKTVLFSSEWLVVVSKDRKSAEDFLEKVKLNIKNIPVWMGLKTLKNNTTGLKLSNESKIDVFACSKGAGRGTSPTMAIMDEAAFYKTNAIVNGIISSIQPSLSRTGGRLFVVSTPNGCAVNSEGYWYFNQVRQLQEAGGFTKLEKLYDVAWWEVPDGYGIKPEKGFNAKLEEYIKQDYFNNPKAKVEARKFFDPIARNHWKENDWLTFQMSSSGKVKYEQEILQNFVIVDNNVFSEEQLESVQKEMAEPIIKDTVGNKHLRGFWVWKEPQPNHRYVMTVDIARGSGDDDSCIQVLDQATLEQVAEYSGKCTTIDLAHYAYNIGEYYNWAYNITECNSIGEATFNELYYNLNYPNLFKEIKRKNNMEVVGGWNTNVKTRELITHAFIQFNSDEKLRKMYHPHSERLLSQMRFWIWKGGKPDHSGSTHDDNIMAMAIALYNISNDLVKVRSEDDVVFYDSEGREINAKVGDGMAGSLTDRFMRSNEDKGRTLNESVYRKMEHDMYRTAGIDPTSEDAADTLRWLYS